MRRDASALVRFSSKSTWASSLSVFRYERCAPVIGSSPVTQSSGSFSMLPVSAPAWVRLSVMTQVGKLRSRRRELDPHRRVVARVLAPAHVLVDAGAQQARLDAL